LLAGPEVTYDAWDYSRTLVMTTTPSSVEISIVSPVYRASSLVEDFVRAVVSAVEGFTADFELVLVEDGGEDGSWEEIKRLALRDRRVRGIKLSRNFGQHQALTAGLGAARGRYVLVLDCDLQDDPGYIRELYEKARSGHDIVLTLKQARAHSAFKNVTARLFKRVFDWLAGPSTKYRPEVGSFSILSRKAVNAFLEIRDYHRHYLMVLAWLGFPPAYLEVVHRPRPKGKSSYGFRKLVIHAVNGITSQSNRLLYLSIGIGLLFFLGSVAGASYLIVRYLVSGFKEGWTSTMVTILMSAGCILMAQGVLGIYIGKIFEQARGRPLYVVDEWVN
jgi:polyisoprenyl-phosphate glycosyltransferase